LSDSDPQHENIKSEVRLGTLSESQSLILRDIQDVSMRGCVNQQPQGSDIHKTFAGNGRAGENIELSKDKLSEDHLQPASTTLVHHQNYSK
jgi:hypothetical protein